jgi:hypothetical protein
LEEIKVIKMWKYFLNNPTGRAVGDCSVRAVSVALGVDWETAYAMLAVNGFAMGDLQNSNSVIGSVLRQHGFYRYNFPETCPACYTFGDFAKDNPRGVFVLGTGTHVATVKDGILYDAWDSSNEPVSFAWYRKD